MRIEITNVDELIYFLNEQWERITDFEFNNIIHKTLSIYADGKPETKDEAFTKIRTIWQWIETHPPDQERPLFFIDENLI